MLDQVYTVHDSSNESQKEELEAVPVGAWWDWVSIGRYWLIYDGTGSVEAVLVGNWWYWVSMEYWLIYDGTGSVEGGTGW